MHTSSLAIHIDSDISEQILDLYKQFFTPDYDDMLIISDVFVESNKSWAVIPSFYLRFFTGSVLFTDIASYISYKDALLSKNILLATSSTDLMSNNINLNMLKNTKIVTISNNSIEVTNYAELRPTI